MKQPIILSLFLFATTLFAQVPTSTGVKVHVELLSGTQQNAQFLGIANDTVQLGGYIQNKFTVIKLSRDKFKRIVDEQGNDLLATPRKEATEGNSAQAVNTPPPQGAAEDTSTARTSRSLTLQYIADKKASHAFISFESENLGLDPEITQQITKKANVLVFELLRDHTPNLVAIVPDSVRAFCNDQACVQSTLHSLGVNTLHFGKISHSASKDSANLELTTLLYEDTLPTIYKTQKTFSLRNFTEDALTNNKLKNLVNESLGQAPVEERSRKNYVHVETDPEGATLSRADSVAICKSPCTFALTDTSRLQLYAYWNVDRHLWGASATVKPVPGDTAKLSLRLKRITPEISITTFPEGAEIFSASEQITKQSKALGTTPTHFIDTEPGFEKIRLRKEGYRDTLVQFYVAPIAENTIDIQMERLTDHNELMLQNQWLHDRKMYNIGRTLMGTAIAPVAIGALFAYLAKQDYSDADNIKSELKKPGSKSGAHFQEKIRENRNKVKDGDRKIIIGSSLAGAGLVLFGIGLYLTF